MNLSEYDTYVYIDVSNIRSACLKTLGLKVDFRKLIEYLRAKYPNLQDVRYYEGIAVDDEKKRKMFKFLKGVGYTICPLERKSYNSVETDERVVRCPRCGNRWDVKFRRERKVMKSNVDVYLATELLTVAHEADKLAHIILVSCDGDYAEMIRNALKNKNVSISVLATPMVRDFTKNTLSVRLKRLYSELGDARDRYHLRNIENLSCFQRE